MRVQIHETAKHLGNRCSRIEGWHQAGGPSGEACTTLGGRGDTWTRNLNSITKKEETKKNSNHKL